MIVPHGHPAAQPARAAVPKELLLALAGASLFAAGAVVTGVVVTQEQSSMPAAARGSADNKSAEVRQKIDAQHKAMEQEKRKLEAARLLNQAARAEAERRYTEAEKLYGEALRLSPGESDAVTGLVNARVAQASEARIRDETAGRDGDYARLMSQGKEALAKKQFVLASRSFAAAGQARPGDADAVAGLAQAEQARLSDEQNRQKVADYQTQFDTGKAALAAKRYQDAVQAFLVAQRLNPNDEVAAALKQAQARLNEQMDRDKRQRHYADLMERAQLALRRRHYEAASEALESALKLFPDDREAKELLRKAQKDKKDARGEFNRLMTQGNAALQNQQVNDAARYFSSAAALVPDDPSATQMVKQLDQLLSNANNTQAVYLRSVIRGTLAQQSGLFADAVASFSQALQIAPNDPEALVGLRQAQASLNGVAVLSVDYDRLMSAGAQSLRLRQWGDAVKAYGDALRVAPGDVAATAGLAQARYQRAMAHGQSAMANHHFFDAARFFQEALNQSPGDVQATTALRQAQALRH